jgi:hypothetical protein
MLRLVFEILVMNISSTDLPVYPECGETNLSIDPHRLEINTVGSPDTNYVVPIVN